MAYVIIYCKRWLIGVHCLVGQGPATTKSVLRLHVCAHTTWARVCVPYHCKPFCWCFLLLILSLGCGYIKLLSGLPVWEKKSCLKCFCAHVHCPQYKDSKCVCVWDGDKRKQSEGEGHRSTTIYRGRKRLRGGRGRQRGGRSIVWCLAQSVE